MSNETAQTTNDGKPFEDVSTERTEPTTIGETLSYYGQKIWNKIHDVGEDYIEKPLKPVTEIYDKVMNTIPYINKAYRVRKSLTENLQKRWDENPYYFGGAIDTTLSYTVPPDEWRILNDAKDVGNTLIYGTVYKSNPKWNFRTSRFWTAYRLRNAQVRAKYSYYRNYNAVRYRKWK